MKSFFILFLLFSVLLLVSCKAIEAGDDVDIGDDVLVMIPVYLQPQHREHTHDHDGGSCCPCGVCHKHDGEHTHEELTIWARIVSCVIAFSMLLSVLHEFLLNV